VHVRVECFSDLGLRELPEVKAAGRLQIWCPKSLDVADRTPALKKIRGSCVPQDVG